MKILNDMMELANELIRSMNFPLPHYIKILVVDDNSTDVDLLKKVLSIDGLVNYSIDWESNCEVAIKKVLENKYDVYFIDFKLGPMTATEFIQECMKRGAHGPFMVWSGYSTEKELEEALNSNIIGFFPKNILVNFPSTKQTYLIIDSLIRYAIKNYRLINSSLEFKKSLDKKTKEYLNATQNATQKHL